MKLKLKRLHDNGDSTIGYMTRDNRLQCYTLEDQFQTEKVNGETRIPAGVYKIKFREVFSPFTKKYRSRYDWFSYHLELQDVNGFKYVYIHSGNSDDHTNGCILVGYTQEINAGMRNGFVGHSRDAFKDLYLSVAGALLSGIDVSIEIIDE